VTTTRWVWVAIILSIIAVDFILVWRKKPTLSYALQWVVQKWKIGWIVPFAIGMLASHWCWR
jgi:hypothetical protein